MILVVAQAREKEIEKGEEWREERVSRSRIGYQAEIAKPPLFSREVRQVAEFVTTCKLYKDEDERGESRRTSTVNINI